MRKEKTVSPPTDGDEQDRDSPSLPAEHRYEPVRIKVIASADRRRAGFRFKKGENIIPMPSEDVLRAIHADPTLKVAEAL